MKINKLFLTLLLAVNFYGFSQNQKKEVLFTIDEKPYYSDEFLRVYNKNIDLVKDESQKDLNNYLDLFVGYKLKISKANKLGLQNNQKYITEFKSYRTQLSKNYTSDVKVTKALIEEGYNRSQKEIRASHILLTVDENAAPADTLKVYNEAISLRKRAVSGESFESLAEKLSQDPSAKENKGDLGYFSAFRMVYAFENAAFKTKVGEISMPVRTRFGYHLIKVVDSRANRGEVTVAHIMILKADVAKKDEEAKAKATIQDIYTKLKQGENFESLASQFSQDKSSSARGGVLQRFASGQLSSNEFEDVAFSLTKPNSYSEPFQSQFGWHIVKLIEKYPIKKFEEMERDLDTKIRKDDRSRLITNSLTSKLRKKYTITRDDKCYNEIVSKVSDKFYNNEWNQEGTKNINRTLFKIDKFEVNASSFIAELEAKQKENIKIKPIAKLVDYVYQNFVDTQITNYYNDNLESEFPEFANITEEYRDGLLLFDLMEKEIWEKAKQDSVGLKKYFDANQAKYQWKKRSEVTIASSTNNEVIKSAAKFLKQDKTADFIKQNLNTKEVVNVMLKDETIEEGTPAANKNIPFKTGLTEVYQEGNFYFVTKIKKTLPAGNKKLDEIKGKVINDYQQYLEDNWVSDLKKEFKVNVNQDVFSKIKATLKK
jgi:peptidyl-prolyl cis-trans isomerase SurA